MTLEEYSAYAVARFNARLETGPNRMKVSPHWMNATFFWNGCRYQVEVMGHEVAFLRTLPEVRAFCANHNREF